MSIQFEEKEIQKAHKHIKGCSTSFIIRKMQIKSTQRDHFSPIRLAKIQKSDTPRVGKAQRRKHSCTCWWERKTFRPTEGNLTMWAKVTNA